jgi:hypothetical protein
MLVHLNHIGSPAKESGGILEHTYYPPLIGEGCPERDWSINGSFILEFPNVSHVKKIRGIVVFIIGR